MDVVFESYVSSLSDCGDYAALRNLNLVTLIDSICFMTQFL